MNAIDKLVYNYAIRKETLRAQISKSVKNEAFIKLMKYQKVLSRVEVKTWRQAHHYAIDIERPSRVELMDVYSDALLDPHLQTVLQTRFLNLQNLPAEIFDLDSGEVDEDLTPLINKIWFYKTNRLILESIAYGYTLLKFDFLKDGSETAWKVGEVSCFPREHVVPEFCAVRPDVDGDDMVYLDDDPYNRFYILIDTQELGLLQQASRMTIFKKYAINHWSRYQDIFGIPPVTATTTSRDDKVWDKIEENIRSISSNLGGVFPEGTDLNVHEMKNTDVYNLFHQAAKFADEQNSKLFLGGTGNTDEKALVGSAEVHERSKNDLLKSDVRFCEHIWNDRIFPFLTEWGYPLQGKGVRFNMSSKLKLADSQLAIDQWISQDFEIDPDYIEETYGTPVNGRKQFGGFAQPEEKEDAPKQ